MLDDMVAKDQQAARNGMYGAYQRRVVRTVTWQNCQSIVSVAI